MNYLSQTNIFQNAFEKSTPSNFEEVNKVFNQDKIEFFLLMESIKNRFLGLHAKFNPLKKEFFASILEDGKKRGLSLVDIYEELEDIQNKFFDDFKKNGVLVDSIENLSIDEYIHKLYGENDTDEERITFDEFMSSLEIYINIRERFFKALDEYNKTIGAMEITLN